jgi:hypothetical protein
MKSIQWSLIVGGGCVSVLLFGAFDAQTAPSVVSEIGGRQFETTRARRAIETIQGKFTSRLRPPIGLSGLERSDPVPVLGSGAVTALIDRGAFLEPRIASADETLAKVELPKTADAAFRLTDVRSEKSVQVRLIDARAVAPELGSGVVIYPDAFLGGSYLHSVSTAGTEDYVLYQRPVAEELRYEVELEPGLVGLRLVANTLEFLDRSGIPRLRASAPWLIDAAGQVRDANLSLPDCAADTTPAPPWGKAVTEPGRQRCTVRVSWSNAGLSFPILVDPSWSTTGIMGARRTYHIAKQTNGGGILVAGGINFTTATVLSSAEVYCTVGACSGTWTAVGSMATPRYAHGAIAPYELSGGGVTYTIGPVRVFGGLGAGSTYLSSSETYNSGAWSPDTSMSTARAFPGVARYMAGRVLVAGGHNAGGALASVESSGTTGAWAPLTPMSSTRVFHTATALTTTVPLTNQGDSPVLVAGGRNVGGTVVAVAQRFEPASGVWVNAGTMYSAVYSHTATQVLAGAAQYDVFVADGADSVGPATRRLQRYSRVAGTWSLVTTLGDSRARHAATLLSDNQTILWTGGINSVGAPSSAISYNTNSGTTVASTMPAGNGRQAHTATLVGSQVLLAGGADFAGTTSFDTALLYTP